jgi:hypothetical protein
MVLQRLRDGSGCIVSAREQAVISDAKARSMRAHVAHHNVQIHLLRALDCGDRLDSAPNH